MLFGLNKAPVLFQRAKDVILASVKRQHAVVFIDDIIIKVVRLARDAGMTIKLKKIFSIRKDN